MRKTIKMFSLMAAMVLALVTKSVWADAAAPAAPAAAATPAAPTVVVGGMVDGYYSYNFSNSGTNSGIGNVGYFYNNVDNSFTLGLAEVKVTATQGPASAHLVLAYGQEGALGLLGSGLDVLQGYLSYNPGQWTFNLGRFVTWMGYEVIESNANMNYSHSLLFGAIPFWHTGVSASFAPSSSFTITGYLTDGNGTTVSSPDGKEFGLEAIINASQWTFTLNSEMGSFAGNSGASNNLANFTGEAIIGFKPDSMWSFALDAQYGMSALAPGLPTTQPAPSYMGFALYGRDQIASDWAVALRLEDLMDSGELGFGQLSSATAYTAGSAMEGTLTLEHNLSANMLVRLEGRYDTNALPTVTLSSLPYATTTTAAAKNYGGGTSTSQVTTTLGAVLSF